MPLDPDHRQGGCFNPPWATRQDLWDRLVSLLRQMPWRGMLRRPLHTSNEVRRVYP